MSSDAPPSPSATYRLQLTPEFTFADAADVVPYLAELGVSHVYCSPILEAAPGSTHGYDVVDPTRLRDELGGPGGFGSLVAACHDHGLGVVVDVVPNHMHVGVPEDANIAWWDVLKRGRSSPFADWFDIDWEAPGLDGKVLIPVLGEDPSFAIADDTLRYGDHVFPLAEGTASMPIGDLLAAQHYRLAHWREESRTLNYRRFFGISTLAGVRVELPGVFDATHELIGEMTRRGAISGVRIDHPDGLSDPAGYLESLAAATDGAWTVVEKILEADEELPADWRCDGTTGYDALNFVDGLFVDPSAEPAMTKIYAEFSAATTDWDEVVRTAKHEVLDRMLAPEVARLGRLITPALDAEQHAVEEALRALLVAMPIYRAYIRPGHEPDAGAVRVLSAAAADAARSLAPVPAKLVDRIRELLLDGPAEIVTRFQQTSGPAMAKGVEDTAFYRFHRLVSLCEVGGDPGHFGRSPDEFHTYCRRLTAHHPTTMTTLSTHDTKRAEDVRMRIAVLSELPDEWHSIVARWSQRAAAHWQAPGPDHNIEYLIWQTLVGAWPIDTERLTAYVEKAAREAGQRTAWVDGDPAYDNALTRFVEQVLAEGELCAEIDAFVQRIQAAAVSNSLAQKLVQLTMPGVPDIYQGCESVDLSLVDPDNRRPVDFSRRRQTLADGSDRKQRLVATTLQFRRDRPDAFGRASSYVPVQAAGPAAQHLVGFLRSGDVAVLATRLPMTLERDGGWRDTVVPLPAGTWVDLLSGRAVSGGDVAIGELLDASPVALLGKTTRTPD
jgi:(1->4)-alpha-D-glucan 1-alpha-D-glucosylmutase